MMKTIKRLCCVFLACVCCVTLLGCESEEDRLAAEREAEESRIAAEKEAEEAAAALAEQEAQAKREEILEKICDVLEWVPAVDGWSLSMSSAIANTFHQYKWDFEPYQGSDTRYLVTFQGYYSPNPRDLPELSQSGSISLIVDIKNNTATIYSDPNNISSAFILLALPY